eukprot:7944-Pelagococcus_subviridis.AAC.2
MAAALEARQRAILSRLDVLERDAVVDGVRAMSTSASASTSTSEEEHAVDEIPVASEGVAFPLPRGPPETSLRDDGCDVAVRLNAFLTARGAAPSKFVRVPAQYYDETLEFRASCLRASSIHRLCKTICMENTKWNGDPSSFGRANARHYVVVVQYTARLSQQKLERWLHELNAGAVAKSRLHMRVAKEEDSERITGYKTGGVVPFAMREGDATPVVLSHRIAALGDDAAFWLGGGEVDLKLRVGVKDFVRATDAYLVDCTYDD